MTMQLRRGGRKKTEEMNTVSHLHAATTFFLFLNFVFISSVIMDRMCLYIRVCSGIGADTR